MLRTITELVPYGDDTRAKRITVQYLANCGRYSSDTYLYLVGFYEQPSRFNSFEDEMKFCMFASDQTDNLSLQRIIFRQEFSSENEMQNRIKEARDIDNNDKTTLLNTMRMMKIRKEQDLGFSLITGDGVSGNIQAVD